MLADFRFFHEKNANLAFLALSTKIRCFGLAANLVRFSAGWFAKKLDEFSLQQTSNLSKLLGPRGIRRIEPISLCPENGNYFWTNECSCPA